MLEEYGDLIRRFHQALIRRDRNALEGLLTEQAASELDAAFQKLEQSALPLSDDVSVTGIEIEGSGRVIQVHYTNRVGDREYHMILGLTEVDGMKIDQSIPHLASE